MGFKKVYKALQEIFPEVDSRLLRAVAIEHHKDPDAAVEVVFSEVIPRFTGSNKPPSTSSSQSGVTVTSSEVAACVDVNGAPHTDSALPDNAKDSDEVHKSGHPQTFEDIADDSLQHFHDAVGEDVVFEGDGIDKSVSMEKCQVTNVMPTAEDWAKDDLYGKCGSSASTEVISFKRNGNNETEVASNQFSQLTECMNVHHSLEETDNSPYHDSSAFVHKGMHEEVSVVDNEDLKHSESQLAPLNAQTSTLDCSESSIVLVAAPDVQNFELDEAELNDTMAGVSDGDLACDMLVNEFMPNPVASASGHIYSVDLLEDVITEAKSNKKTLSSAMESVICMMREVELQEEAAEKAKEEAAKGGLDMLGRVEEMKEMLRHAKGANDMHAGEVYGEKAILGTEVKELQSRLLGLADERDKSLAILDEMHQALEVRMGAAEKERKVAEQERLEKEGLARKALADQELIMEKVVKESNVLKQEAEENAKLRDFLVDRGHVVDTLQGEISVICQDVRLLKQKFDDRVPLSKSLTSSQTSCLLASSSSSMKSMVPDQVPEPADLLDTPEKIDMVSSYEGEHQASGDETLVIQTTDPLDDDGWELF